MSAAFRRMWGWPILLGVVTMVGLIAALLGDGVWDHLSGLALAVPVAVAGWLSLMKRGDK